jgi:hypothetical protein
MGRDLQKDGIGGLFSLKPIRKLLSLMGLRRPNGGPSATALDDLLVFVICLKSKRHSNDWDAVSKMLSATLRSILASSDDRFRIVVAGHEKPDIEELKDPRAVFVEAPFPVPEVPSGHDRWLKRVVVGEWVRKRTRERVRVMFLDADDLVHKQLVRAALRSSPRVSLIVDKGYRFDKRDGALQPIGKFDRRCGSCFIPVFRRDELPRHWRDKRSAYAKFRTHAKFRALCAELGKPVETMDFFAVVYMTNHAESLEYSKKGMREGLIDSPLPSEQSRDILRNEFAYDL